MHPRECLSGDLAEKWQVRKLSVEMSCQRKGEGGSKAFDLLLAYNAVLAYYLVSRFPSTHCCCVICCVVISPQPAARQQLELRWLLSVRIGVGDGFGHRDVSEALAIFILQRQSPDKRVDDEDGDAVGHEGIIAGHVPES
jgi:hypothetical protein